MPSSDRRVLDERAIEAARRAYEVQVRAARRRVPAPALPVTRRDHEGALDAAVTAYLDALAVAAGCVLDNIRAERHRQDAKWGGPEHDDEHDPLHWCGFVGEHLARARKERGVIYRYQMIRVAALAIAAVESFDRRAALGLTTEEENRDG
jgi:hypothetical protein